MKKTTRPHDHKTAKPPESVVIGLVASWSCGLVVRGLKLASPVGLVCFLNCALPANAQPETFGGNPDSSAFIRIRRPTDDWTRHFRVGALVGMDISAQFKQNGSFGVSGNNVANGIYDNGYAHPSGNAFGTTTAWGYQSASQYDAAHHTLTMNATTAFSAATSASASGGPFSGFEMAYGDNLWYWKHARVGWEVGFGLLPISLTSSQSTTGPISQNTYTFSTGAIGSLPPPGYAGPGSGSAPAIFSTPVATNQMSASGTINGSQKLDVMLYTLRAGPSFYWDLNEHVGLSLGAGPAVGLVSGDYKYDETITFNGLPSHNSGRIGGTAVIFGGYVNGTLMYHVQANGNADIFVSAQFMPMGDATISGAGRSGRLNFGGQLYVSAGINWPF